MSEGPKDPRAIIADAPMTMRQKLVVGLCILLNGLDGFDVLSVSFAAPGISKEWGIERAALGIVLSMELVGMAIGSIALGQLADRVGRRVTTLFCLALMAIGMLLAALSASPASLGSIRFMTGLGIGGLLASISALAAGASNTKARTMSVALMAAGYPLGAVIGGAISSQLLAGGDWRNVFYLGAGLTIALLPVAASILPEGFDTLLRRKSGPERLEAINRSLKMLGHSPISGLIELAPTDRPAFATLFTQPLRPLTILLTSAYFLHMMSFYFMLKWIPKIVADLGVPASQAASVLVWANVGGVIGSFGLSLLTARFPLRGLMIAVLSSSAIFLVLFGNAPAELSALSWAAAAAGFSTNAVIVGLYALIAASYPPHLRGGGTGLVIGLGRGGAALGPIVGGLLFSAGLDRGAVALVMASGSALAVLAVIQLFRSQAFASGRV